MNNKFKIGDYVTRKKYNNDIIFKIYYFLQSEEMSTFTYIICENLVLYHKNLS